MSDLYEQRENERRKERERDAAQWTAITKVTIGVLITYLGGYLIVSRTMRACRASLFGYASSADWCTLTQTWNWLLSGADRSYWAITGIVIAVAAVKWLSSRK